MGSSGRSPGIRVTRLERPSSPDPVEQPVMVAHHGHGSDQDQVDLRNPRGHGAQGFHQADLVLLVVDPADAQDDAPVRGDAWAARKPAASPWAKASQSTPLGISSTRWPGSFALAAAYSSPPTQTTAAASSSTRRAPSRAPKTRPHSGRFWIGASIWSISPFGTSK
jgi:hypothetical protein